MISGVGSKPGSPGPFDKKRAGSDSLTFLFSETQGFSLIEVVIVIAILSILAGMMAPLSVHLVDRENTETTLKEMSEIKDGLLHYYEDINPHAFPAALRDLITAPTGPTGWNGPYFSGTVDQVQKDAWGTDYIYLQSGNYALLISGGNDKTVDTNSYNDFPPADTAGDSSDLVLNINGNLIAETLDREKIDETRETLKIVAGEVYNSNPASPPSSYTPTLSDAWGNSIQYNRLNNYSAKIYSYGVNGSDDFGSGDDLVIALLWPPS